MRSRSARLYRYTGVNRLSPYYRKSYSLLASRKWRTRESRQTTCLAGGAKTVQTSNRQGKLERHIEQINSPGISESPTFVLHAGTNGWEQQFSIKLIYVRQRKTLVRQPVVVLR